MKQPKQILWCLKNWSKTDNNLKSIHTWETANLWVCMNCGNTWPAGLGNSHLCSFADIGQGRTWRQEVSVPPLQGAHYKWAFGMLFACNPPVKAGGDYLHQEEPPIEKGLVTSALKNPDEPLSYKSLWKMVLVIRYSEKGRQCLSKDAPWDFGLVPFLVWLPGTSFLKSDNYYAPRLLSKLSAWPMEALWLSCQIDPFGGGSTKMQQLTRWKGPNRPTLSNENGTCKKTAGLILVAFQLYKEKWHFSLT